MIIGYARVSTQEQNLELQTDELTRAGCERIFKDRISGASTERPDWEKAKSILRKGDTLIVWRLDRLGRSLKHLIETITELDERAIGFKSLRENIDTTTTGGRLVFHIFGALAEFERDLIRDRTNAGLAAARARGRVGGRPRKLDPQKLDYARYLMKDPKRSMTSIARELEVGRSTLYRALTEDSHNGKKEQE